MFRIYVILDVCGYPIGKYKLKGNIVRPLNSALESLLSEQIHAQS